MNTASTKIISIFLFLIFSMIMNIAKAQWAQSSMVNVKVSQALNDQQDQHVATDGNNGVILTWADFRASTSNPGVYVQRMDNKGIVKWTTDGVSLCATSGITHSLPDLTEDEVGGAIVVWQDWRNGNKDLFAQRVDSNGAAKWTACGLPVVVKANDQQSPKMVTDGAQGAIVVWQDSSGSNWDIFAQRLDMNGAQMWASAGVSICSSVDEQINSKMTSDGAGGAIITWQDKRNGSDYDVYAQRINASGVVQWAANGVGVCVTGQSQNNPKIKSDGSGGAYIAWADKRTGTDYDIYAQRLSSSGTASWTANGVAVCSATGNQSALDMAYDATGGGVIITWKDIRSGTNHDIYTQKVNNAGVVQWAANGVAVTTASNDQINPDAVSDGSGGAVIVWQDSSAGNWDVYSQRINSAGSSVWAANGVTVGNASANQTNPKLAIDGNGGAIYVFQDKRNGNWDLYAHHLNNSGTPDFIWRVNEVNSGLEVYPQPALQRVEILSDKKIIFSSIKIYDVLGKDVSKNFSSEISSEGKVTIARTQAETGVYFITLQGNGGILLTSKLIFQN